MDETTSIDEQISNFRWLVLALLFINIFVAFVGIQCIPPLFMEIGADIPLTKTQIGLVMGILTLPSILFSPIGGAVTDRIGSRWAFGTAILVVAVAGAARGFVDSANGLVVCMFFVGIGTATTAPNISKSLSMWFPKNEFAMANGICLLAMPLSAVLGMGTAAGILSPFLGGWRNVMIVPGILSVFTAFLWMVLFRDRKVQEAPGAKKPSFKENFKTVLKIKGVQLSTMFYFVRFIATSSLLALLPIMLSERGLTPGKAGAFVAIMMGSNSLFKIIGGTASDKLGRRKPFLIVCTIVQSLCVFAFAIVNGIPLIIALVIAGVCMGCIAPVFMASLVETEGIGPALAGTTVGLVFMIGNIGGFVGPIISGKLMDVTGVQWPALIFMGLCFVAAAFIILPLKDTGIKKNKETANAH